MSKKARKGLVRGVRSHSVVGNAPSIFTTFEFPHLSPELAKFVELSPTRVAADSSLKCVTEMGLKQLQEIRKRYKQLHTKPFNPTIPSVSTSLLYRLPSNINFAIRHLRKQTEEFRRLNNDFFQWSFTLVDELITFLNATIESGVPARCFADAFDLFINGEYKGWRLAPMHRGSIQISNMLKNVSLKQYLDPNDSKIRRICRELASSIDEKNEWCPVNELDTDLAFYFDVKNMNEFITQVCKMITGGDSDGFDGKLAWLAKKLEIDKPNEIIVLKSSLIRVAYDALYIANPRELMCNDNIEAFIAKCSYIASFSPRQLGLNLNLFSPDLADAPMMRIVRDNQDFRMISMELSNMQFMSCLPEVFMALEKVLMQFDNLAHTSELKRKLGKFVTMVEGEPIKKRVQFMSFDDYFSLFFAVLAVEPPANALALAKWMDSIRPMANASMVNYVKATFIGAIEHIMQFGQQNLKIADQVEDEMDDPLGISIVCK